MTKNVNIVGYLPNVCGCSDCGCGAGFDACEVPAANAVRVVSVLNDIATVMAAKYEMTNEDVAQSHLSEVATALEREAGLPPAEAEKVAKEVICHLWGAEFSIECPE